MPRISASRFPPVTRALWAYPAGLGPERDLATADGLYERLEEILGRRLARGGEGHQVAYPLVGVPGPEVHHLRQATSRERRHRGPVLYPLGLGGAGQLIRHRGRRGPPRPPGIARPPRTPRVPPPSRGRQSSNSFSTRTGRRSRATPLGGSRGHHVRARSGLAIGYGKSRLLPGLETADQVCGMAGQAAGGRPPPGWTT